jgi:hypothetical protein
MLWPWSRIEPYFVDLAHRPILTDNVDSWLTDWTSLSQIIYETHQRLYVATNVNTTDKQAELHYQAFLDEIYPPPRQLNKN